MVQSFENGVMIMTKREREMALFESIRVDHGLETVPFAVTDKKATEQWLQNHDRLPTLDEINQVIKEVRDARQ